MTTQASSAKMVRRFKIGDVVVHRQGGVREVVSVDNRFYVLKAITQMVPQFNLFHDMMEEYYTLHESSIIDKVLEKYKTI